MNSGVDRRLHVGVDARSLCGSLTGIGHYVHEVLKRLDAESITLYCAPCAPAIPLQSNWRIRVSRLPRQIALRYDFSQFLERDGVDVFWAAQTLVPKLGLSTPVVSTVHDINHILVPNTMSWGTRLAHKLWFNRDLESAERVVANSMSTAFRVRQCLGLDVDGVARPGVSAAFRPISTVNALRVLSKYKLPSSFILAVGTIEPRKNIQSLLEAHAKLFADKKVPELVLVGKLGWKISRNSLVGSGVRALGYVPDSDLPSLYSLASVFVIPSLYEGYGMSAAEARACGCRVVATDIPELRESAGLGSIFVDPTSEGIASGILTALDSEKPNPASSSTWDECAGVYARIFQEVVSNSRACNSV